MPRQGSYDWGEWGEPPPIDGHSIAKHRLLDGYLRDYVRTLAQNPARRELNLTVVDGFAGGGLYLGEQGETHLGSPLLVIRAVEEAAALESARRRDGLAVQVQYVFVEKQKAATVFLGRALAEHGLTATENRTIDVLRGSFEEHADAILAAAKRRSPRSHRTIFVLDQYGWNQVPMPIVQRIFREFRRPEVILTFSVDKFANTLSDTPEIREAVRRWDPELDFDHWLRTRLESGSDWRGEVQHLLHNHFAASSGARFYTPFYIASSLSNLSYWLIHLSNHVRARDVMTGTHWSLGNCFEHDGGPGLDMFMGYDPRKGGIDRSTYLYQFDDRAETLTLDTLQEQLPKRIRDQHPDGVALLDLYAREANTQPATTAHFRRVAERLVDSGQLVIVDDDGRETRAARVEDGTRVRVPRAGPLFALRRPW